MKMKVLLGVHADLGHMLAAMQAVQELKLRNPKLSIHLACPDDGQAALIRGEWFVETVFGCPLGEVKEVDDYVFVHMLDADRTATEGFEKQLRAEQKEQTDRRMQITAATQKIPLEKVPKPLDYDKYDPDAPATWGLVMGYSCSLEDASGWSCQLTSNETKPWLPKSRNVKEITKRWMHVNRDVVKPGMRYVVMDNPDYLASIGITEVPVPAGWQCVPTDERVMPADLIVGLVQHKLCGFVIGPTGGAVYAAWAAGLPTAQIFSDGEKTHWTAVREKSLPLYASDKTLPHTISRTLEMFYERHNL